MSAATVFISYSHDTPEHSQQVLQLANALRDHDLQLNFHPATVRASAVDAPCGAV